MLPVIAVDIETQTRVLPEYPEACHKLGNKFGLSVLAPITDVALYDGRESTIYDLRDWDPWFPEKRGNETIWAAIKAALCQPNIMIVGHNVVFDLRQIIAHYNFWFPEDRFHIPLGAKVWDTYTIATRMLLGEQASRRSPFRDSFALAGGREKKTNEVVLGMSERLGVLQPETPFWEFYVWMKKQRENLSSLDEILMTLPEDHLVWTQLDGWIPPNRPDLLKLAADSLRHEYVVRDAILAYELYQKQFEIAQHLAQADWHHGKLHIPRWPELTERDIHPEFASQLDFWTRRLRVQANRIGRGMKLNQAHVQAQMDHAAELIKINRKEVLKKPDKHDPYPNFERTFSAMLYYKMVLDCAADKGTTFNDVSKWAFWEPLKLAPLVLADALSDVPGKRTWVDWLMNNEFSSGKQVRSIKPGLQDVPEIDLIDWVKRNCYIGYAEPYATLLAEIKSNWLTHYYKTSAATLIRKAQDYWAKHPNTRTEDPLEFGKRQQRRDSINSRIWLPYYIFCVAGAPLPNSDMFKYEAGLTTTKFKGLLEIYRRAHDGGEPADYRRFVIEQRGLSYGKKAIEHFLSDLYDVPDLKPMQILMQAKADLQKFTELATHAALDGAIHSMIINDTKTGRASSNSPNMQNIKMATKPGELPTPFPGTFVAPQTNMTLCEVDLSNAEIRTGNMTAGDNASAAATEGVDRHGVLAEIYASPEVWATYTPDERKAWRSEYKKFTFASAYGAGPHRLALLLRATREQVLDIINNTKRTFWKIEEQKKKVSDNAVARMNAGCVPVFVSLWSRERVQVDRVKYRGKIECVAYTGWNSLQQGGVTALLSRADVLISEMLEREGYLTFIQHDVHDALIFAFNHEEYLANNRALPVRIHQMMSSIMPEEYCERTIPKTHFVTALGPENAKKWGYNPFTEYALPLNEFTNQYGVFPTDEEEAPTWIGPLHEGWTLEKETASIAARKQAYAALDNSDGMIAHFQTSGDAWVDLQNLLATLPQATDFTLRLLQPLHLIYTNKAGKPVDAGHLPFAAWMAAGQVLYHNGNGQLYEEMLRKISSIVTTQPEHFAGWIHKYPHILQVLA